MKLKIEYGPVLVDGKKLGEDLLKEVDLALLDKHNSIYYSFPYVKNRWYRKKPKILLVFGIKITKLEVLGEILP